MTMHLHVLKGCAPVPLANYLKALGVLRLVGEQIDPAARGWWEGERFCLLTNLTREDIDDFFLVSYEPTPLLSPWNKGCGFFKANDPGLAPLENSIAPRFQAFRNGIREARRLLDEIGHADASIRAIKARTKTTPKAFQTEAQRLLLATDPLYCSTLQGLREQLATPDVSHDERAEILREVDVIESLTRQAAKPSTKADADGLKRSAGYKRLLASADRRFKSLKNTLIPDCRRDWRGPHASWLTAAVVVDDEGAPNWPSLLGTGGNDGNLDFTNNFMQQLGEVFSLTSSDGAPSEKARSLLSDALWAAPTNQLAGAAIGQFQPGSAGGANSSTGFGGGNLVNSWDFLLMMEGTVLFTSRATRRLDPQTLSRVSAPFAVRPHAAGFATPGAEKSQRGEQWMPLWRQPTLLSEFAMTLAEARAQLARQTACRPIDMARAISRLGVARGIDSFVRYGYLERNGQSTLAVPLGRIHVRHQPRDYLIDDLAGWMERLQRIARDKHAPARLVHAERRLADSIFAALTHDDSPDRWQAILLAAAEIELLQTAGTGIEAGPIPPLRVEWASALAEDSPEFRLAMSLASAAAMYARNGRPVDSIRHHFLPMEPGARRFKTAEKKLINDPRVVVSGRAPLADLAAIVDRRVIEAEKSGRRLTPLVAAIGCESRLDDLTRFLAGEVHCGRLVGMARGLLALKWDNWSGECFPGRTARRNNPDECWLAIRLCYLPWQLLDAKCIPSDERILRLLRAGDATRAIDLARKRLRSAGIRMPAFVGATDPVTAMRWAAALAFPINRATALDVVSCLDPSYKGTSHV